MAFDQIVNQKITIKGKVTADCDRENWTIKNLEIDNVPLHDLLYDLLHYLPEAEIEITIKSNCKRD